MAYPQPPDFVAPGASSFEPPAWWTYTRDDGAVNVCATTGAAALKRVRSILGLSPSAAWDDELQAALVARARALDAAQPNQGWAGVVAALEGAQRARALDPAGVSLRFALWLGYYQPHGLRLDAIGVPAGARLPAWNAPLAASSAGANDDTLVCFDPARDPAPGVLTDAQLAAARAASGAGIRLHAGEAVPQYVPTGPLPQGPGGLTRVALGVALVLGVGAVVAVVAANQRDRSAGTSRSRRR